MRGQESKRLKHKALVKLIDRPVAITVARMWASLTSWERVKLCCTMALDSLRSVGSVLQKSSVCL